MLLSCCLPLDGHLATDSSYPNSYWLNHIQCWSGPECSRGTKQLLVDMLWRLLLLCATDCRLIWVLTGCSHIYCQSHSKCSRCYTCWLSLAQMCSRVCCCLCDLKNWVVCSLASQSCWSVSTSHISLSWVVSVEHTWPNNHNAFQFAAAEQLKVNGDRNWNDSSELTFIDTSCDSFVS